MIGKSPVRLLVVGSRAHIDAVASRADGGAVLDRGVAELAADRYPGVVVEVETRSASGLAAAGAVLEGTAPTPPDVVLLSIDDEVRTLGSRAADPAEAVAAVEADLGEIVAWARETGTRLLVANACTVDPDTWPRSYAALDGEPLGLRAHRLDAMLVRLSHDQGISVVDVDRVIAHIGAAGNLDAAMVYGPRAAGHIAEEVVAVLDDYGFFDDRPLLEQVGARPGGAGS